jgi:hypothetical protein
MVQFSLSDPLRLMFLLVFLFVYRRGVKAAAPAPPAADGVSHYEGASGVGMFLFSLFECGDSFVRVVVVCGRLAVRMLFRNVTNAFSDCYPLS